LTALAFVAGFAVCYVALAVCFVNQMRSIRLFARRDICLGCWWAAVQVSGCQSVLYRLEDDGRLRQATPEEQWQQERVCREAKLETGRVS
jgi:hypothetical protein